MRFVRYMAVREMRASWRRLLFFFVCIAVGVGAIVTLRSVIHSVRVAFAGEARVLLGADAMITSTRPLPPDVASRVNERLREAGATSAVSIELATMARSAGGPGGRARMVELRAVEAGVPYYGTLRLAGGAPYAHERLRGFGALVAPELLAELGVGVGDPIAIGAREFTIRGVIESEPGRRLGAFSLGPRVLIDAADLDETGLVRFGSRVSTARLVRVADDRLDGLVAALRRELVNQFARVRSYKATEDDIGESFARAEDYLSLVGLAIVILGGVGVSSVTRVFVQQRMKAIAVLKCVGATSRALLAVYVAQVIALGAAGSALGVAVAAVAVRAVPIALAGATPGVAVSYGLAWPAVAQGLGIGVLVSLLFALLPLLDVRHVKPSLLLREEASARRPDLVQVAVAVAVGAALVALTAWQAGSWRVGLAVAAGFAAVASVLHLAGAALVAALGPLSAARWFVVRHAVLHLRRPGSQARIVLVAVGLGSFVMLGVRSLQQTLVADIAVRVSPDAPDMFLLDVQRDQAAAVAAVLDRRRDPGAPPARLLPVLRARVVGVAGREVRLDDYEDVRGRGSLAREYTITYRSALEPNESIVAGRLWDPSPSPAGEVSIEESIRDRFRIGLGDTIRFDVLGRTVSAAVTSVRHVEWGDSRAGGFMFVFRPGVLDEAPQSLVGFLRGPRDAAARAALQAELAAAAPNVSAIDGREIFAAIRSVLDTVTLSVTVVGTLVVLSGLLILAGSVAMTGFRRVYEAAIFKTLGATRGLIAGVLVVEYGLLGMLAGGIGAAGAVGLTWGVSRHVLDLPFRPHVGLTLSGVAATTLLAAMVGVAASWDVLRRKPLATLRAE